MERGFVPFVPHLTLFWDIFSQRDKAAWLDYDFQWLKRCDILYRIGGHSEGADQEEKMARLYGIPIARSIVQLLDIDLAITGGEF
jgi:hypothetical protein